MKENQFSPFLVFTAAESHFLVAQAAALGIGSGANALPGRYYACYEIMGCK